MSNSRTLTLVLLVTLISGSSLGKTLAMPLPSVAGLVFHLDADDPTTISTVAGNRVDQWDDKSSSNNNALSTVVGQRPLYVPGAWDGGVGLSRGVVRFASATDEIMITQNNSPFSGSGFGITVFSVFKLNNAVANFSSIVSQSPQNGGTPGEGMSFVIGSTQGGAAFTDQWGPDGRRAANAVPVAGDGQIVTWSVNQWLNHQTSAEIFYNGVAETMNTYSSDAGPTLDANPFRIGNWDETRGANDMVFPGDIGEILIYSGALSTNDRQSIEAYLDAKWFQVQPVPEPSTLALFSLGLIALIKRKRR